MERRFRLFVQHHHYGGYTVTVPGLPYVPSPSGVYEDEPGSPVSPSLAAHGFVLEEVKEEIERALRKWLSRCDPADLGSFDNYRDGQKLHTVTVELRPTDRHGRKGRDKVRMPFSLLVTSDRGDSDDSELARATQYRVSVPRLTAPPLAFFAYGEEEIEPNAQREIAHYLKEYPLEGLQSFEMGRREFLETITVEFTPLKPSQEREKKKPGETDDYDTSHLRECAVDLTGRASENRLMPCYGRENETAELLNVLAGDGNVSVLLVGPPGVGKTALAHEIVRKIKGETAPKALHKRKVWYTTPAQLIAGCSYVGQWQERMRNIVAECAKKRHLLFIGDVFGLMEAGKWSKGDENMAEFLRPYIADGTVVVLGETSQERLRVAEAKEPGFVGQFRIIKMEETDDDRTLSILSRLAMSLERQHKLRIEPGACEAAVELTRRFQPYLAQPGKAAAFLSRTVSDTAVATTPQDNRPTEDQKPPVISRQAAVAAFARQTGLPEFLLSDHLPLDVDGVKRHFEERLIGQAEPVQTVVDLITVLKAGLNDPNKPFGTFFFVGPTGVGKTEMAKTLAEYLFGSKDRMIRYDMSEYAEPMNVSKLIGSAVGDAEGELTKKIRLQPFSVVLLDEFEKAHPSIYDVCLQLFGEGRVTDAGGRTADFRSAILLMTSNLGASGRDQRRVGLRGTEGASGNGEDPMTGHFRRSVENYFRPEFVNRLDRIVVFRPLDRDAMRQIAQREIGFILDREGITRRNLLVEISDDLLDMLLEKGFHPVYGARPLKREIERQIIVPLARHLVERRILGDHLIQVRQGEDGQIAVSSTALTASRQKVTLSDTETRKMTLTDIIGGLAMERRRLHEWQESEKIKEVETEHRGLMAQTRRKDFDPKDFRTWQRIYAIERVTKRLAQLTERAEYLEEFSAMVRRERGSHERYLSDLARSLADLTRDNDFLEMEILFSQSPESGHALVRIAGIGRTARTDDQTNWVHSLARMYLQWARRKGYDFGVLVETEQYARRLKAEGKPLAPLIPNWQEDTRKNAPYTAFPASDLDGMLERLKTLGAFDIVLSLKGTHVAGFLAGEIGTHKLLTRGEGAGGPFCAAFVGLYVPEEQESGADFLRAMKKHAIEEAEQEKKREPDDPFALPETPDVVRLYQPGGQRFVRDTRTGLETTQVKETLSGDLLDRFLLAYLKSVVGSQSG